MEGLLYLYINNLQFSVHVCSSRFTFRNAFCLQYRPTDGVYCTRSYICDLCDCTFVCLPSEDGWERTEEKKVMFSKTKNAVKTK